MSTSPKCIISAGPSRSKVLSQATSCWLRSWTFSHSKTSRGVSLVFSPRRMVVGSWMRFTHLRTFPSLPVSLPPVLHHSVTNSFFRDYRAKAIWDFEGIYCTSRHLPHVKFAGLIHPGILGCAPSAEVLATWNKREGELIAASKLEGRDVALPPQPFSAHAGASDAALAEKVGKEGARTVPGRPEHGGNCEYVFTVLILRENAEPTTFLHKYPLSSGKLD